MSSLLVCSCRLCKLIPTSLSVSFYLFNLFRNIYRYMHMFDQLYIYICCVSYTSTAQHLLKLLRRKQWRIFPRSPTSQQSSTACFGFSMASLLSILTAFSLSLLMASVYALRPSTSLFSSSMLLVKVV